MTPDELDRVISCTGHRRYRELTADDSPHRDFYRRRVEARAAALHGEPPLPHLAVQARHAAAAAIRATFAAVTGRPLRVSEPLREARLAACHSCDRYRPSDDRCSACGCWQGGVFGHAAFATERCPLGRWPEEVP